MSNKVAIECKQLTKSFVDGELQVDVLNGVNLTVNEGEMLAIIGTSGAGKSTLLHLLGGLDKPTSGEVYIAEQKLTGMSELKKGRLRNQYLGFVYQFHHLLPEFSALENVCLPLQVRSQSTKEIIEQATDMLEQVGLKDRLTHRIGELSGGERQRVAIARALVTQPKCVLADEPTGNLDQKTAGHIYELMLKLNEQLQTSFVIVTHNEQLAEKMQRILILSHGQFTT